MENEKSIQVALTTISFVQFNELQCI